MCAPRAARRIIVSLLLAAVLPAGLAAQPVAVTDSFVISPPYDPPPDLYMEIEAPGVAALGPYGFAVAWGVNSDCVDICYDIGPGAIEGRRVDASGQVGPLFYGAYEPVAVWMMCPALAPTRSGGFILANYEAVQSDPDAVVAQRFGAGSRALEVADVRRLTGEPYPDITCPAVAASPGGRYAVAWAETHYDSHGQPPAFSLGLQVFLPSGEPAADLVAIDGVRERPLLGMDRAGRIVLVWRPAEGGLRGQRFRPGGTPLGDSFTVAEGTASQPVLVIAQDGGFAVAWVEPGKPASKLFLRRFTADAKPAGPAVEMDRAVPGGAGGLLAAADRFGNFALAWGGWLRFFNRRLVPQGDWVAVTASSLALTDAGYLLAVWGEDQKRVRGRLWWEGHEADLCAYRGGRFLCDTAGNASAGVAPAETIAFGLGSPFHTPLLGDIDGDGQADPCLWHAGTFLCDTAHDGGAAELRIRFGQAGDVPLLGDLDGDGRADPCVRRGGLLLCDTAHDGGAAETALAFGRPADVTLLGDVDGDGRADPCLVRGGVFLCDTAHNGGAAETILDLRPALTRGADGVPLLGDLDGDGRADACLAQGASLVCGIFSARGGPPLAVIERTTFAQAGDLLLLGDLDAF